MDDFWKRIRLERGSDILKLKMLKCVTTKIDSGNINVNTSENKEFKKLMETCSKSKSSLAKFNVCHTSTYSFITVKQSDAIKKSVDGDCVIVLPTGSGKSLIFQILPFTIPDSCIIVSCPLDAILCEQADKLGDSCIYLDAATVKLLEKDTQNTQYATQKLRNAQCSYIIGHPELLTSEAVKKIFLTKPWQNKVTHLVVDEAHVVRSWTESDFRLSFKDLKTLRATFPNIKVMALTATATAETIQKLADSLLMVEYQTVTSSPDR